MKIEQGMRLAIEAAQRAIAGGQQPFGSAIVDSNNTLLGVGSGTGTPDNPTRHSEIMAIKMACQVRGGLLYGCTLFQTHEPCMMCCGAINHSKLTCIVWGSSRSDRPDLFRPRELPIAACLTDTTHPALLFQVADSLRLECIHLLDHYSKTATGQPPK